MKTRDLSPMTFTRVELLAARIELTEFVHLMADRSRERTGIDWYGASDAPNTWKALQAAWLESQVNGTPLPIFNGASDKVILTTPEANVAYRYWHDVTHLERNRNFTSSHELDMANFHLWEGERHGLERGSLPWRLLYADAVGNVLHWAVLHRYVVNQQVFILNVVRYGMDVGLLAEMARLGLLAPQVLPFGVDFTTDSTQPLPPTELSS